jgi:hypothetical protein
MDDPERADSDRIFRVEHWLDPAWIGNRRGPMRFVTDSAATIDFLRPQPPHG